MQTIRTVGDVAAVVRGRRADVGLSQTALAEQAGVSRQWLSALERGKASAEVGLVLRVLEVLDLELSTGERAPAGGDRHPIDLDVVLDRHRLPGDGGRAP